MSHGGGRATPGLMGVASQMEATPKNGLGGSRATPELLLLLLFYIYIKENHLNNNKIK
jgi:hypothetical protein